MSKETDPSTERSSNVTSDKPQLRDKTDTMLFKIVARSISSQWETWLVFFLSIGGLLFTYAYPELPDRKLFPYLLFTVLALAALVQGIRKARKRIWDYRLE